LIFTEILLFTFAGFFLGIFTGLTPGIHVNTASFLLLPLINIFNPYLIATAIISMAITHTFFDFVPSILLGAPEADTALSILPGHQMLLERRGLEAIYLTIVGGIGSVFFILLLLPLFLFSIPFLYASTKLYIGWLLIGTTIFMLLVEKEKRKIIAATFLFLLSGALGVVMFSTPQMDTNTLLFPAFTGLFGISTLLLSLKNKTNIPSQNIYVEGVPMRTSLLGVVKGLVSGSVMGVLPALGSAQATVITQEITRKRDTKEFLVSMGAINTTVAIFSLISLYTISKPRSGAAVAVDKLIPLFGFNEMLLLVAVTLFSAGISSLLLARLARRFVIVIQKINYTKMTVLVMCFLVALVFILTGPYGWLLLLVSTAIGLIAPLFGVKRSTCMGVLMLPLIFFYMGIY
jgi:putative membrane protein